LFFKTQKSIGEKTNSGAGKTQLYNVPSHISLWTATEVLFFCFQVSHKIKGERERERDGGKRENKKKESCVGAAPFLHRCRGIKGMTR